MLNPNQSHVLKPVVLASISRVSGDYSIVNTLFAMMGGDYPTTKAEDDLNLLERFLKLNTHSVSFLAMRWQCAPQSVYRDLPNAKTLAKAQAALGNLVLLINDLENRTTGLPPLMQMSTDFLANGAPLPGLA